MNNSNIAQQIQILLNQFNAKNFDYVILKAKQLLKKNPGYTIIYNLLGSSYQNLNNFEEAKINFKEGLKLEPNNIALMNNLGMTYKNLLQYDLANKLFLEIINKKPDYINAYVNLGNLKRDINNFEEAIEFYMKALKINDKNPVVYYSLALAYQGLGKFEQAIEYGKKTTNIDKIFTQADHLISQSMKYKNKNEHYLELTKKIGNKNINTQQKIDIHFSLAKAEEDMGNIKEAAQNVINGNYLKNKLINYDISKETKFFNNLKFKFKKINFDNKDIKKEDNIIFILGMPRSGTTLVEQIISSHSKVFGAGELPILSKIIKDNFINNNQLDSDNFDNIMNKEEKIAELNNTYKNFIKYFDTKKKFITDKAPLNFRWIGFIKKIFPNSKIIHCTRDIKDNCLSMYKNIFEGGLNFTYDQENLVKYYKNYIDLMKFWKSLFGNFVYEVKYENLVTNDVEEIKKLIKFCNLDWEEDCLMFHKNTTPIKTMSTAQARKPIYKSSVKSFEKFKEYFSILNNSL